jgi:two-component system sensor histidine kinase/response regulator
MSPALTESLAAKLIGSEPATATILIVDDHPANLIALEGVLEPLKVRVVKAHSGQEALRQLLHSEVALILLDVQMPVLDGFQTAALIKQVERTRHIPIIFLTAISRDAEHIFKGYQHGAVDYLLKPYEPDALRAKVSVFVDLFQQSARLKLQSAELIEQMRLFEEERRARVEAEAAAKAKEEVLAMVSHDLRNPLAAVSASVAVLARLLPTDDQKSVKHTHVIERSMRQMERLIADLLEMARIEGGRVALSCLLTPVPALLRDTVESHQVLATSRGQTVEVDDRSQGASVWCDQDRLSQVLSNLIGNALKFTPAGGTIGLRTHVSGDRVHFFVSDSGPGISAEQLPHVFEPYWQAKAGNRQGLGLGLAIARGIVEAHGGKLWVESNTPGATFGFSLLRNHPSWAGATEPPRPSGGA